MKFRSLRKIVSFTMPNIQIGNKYTRTLAIRHLVVERKDVLKTVTQDSSISSAKILYLGFEMEAGFNVDDDGCISYMIFHTRYTSIRMKIPLYLYDSDEAFFENIFDSEKASYIITDFFKNGFVKICNCGELSFRDKEDDRCAQCFKLWFINTEDVCSICLKNEGVWSKISCGHLLHKICLERLLESGDGKCPLCRHSFCADSTIHGHPFFEKATDYDRYLQ